MTILYLLTTIIVTSVWFFYFKKINIFNKSNKLVMLSAFSFGVVSVPIVLLINKSDNNLFLDVFYEELIKISLFLIFFLFFKKYMKDPFDYILYISMVSLGFASLESVIKFYYDIESNGENSSLFETYILTRSIFGPLGHLSYGIIAIYGYLKYKFESNERNILIVLKFFFLSYLCHCFHNFIVDEYIQDTLNIGLNGRDNDSKQFHVEYAILILVVYFLLISSVFVTIVNNTLNNVQNFDYKKTLRPDDVLLKLLSGYGFLFVLQFIIYIVTNYNSLVGEKSEEAQSALMFISFKFFLLAFTTIVITMRISRFKFLKARWRKVKLELPFYLLRDNYFIKMKGDSNDEAIICSHHNEYFELHPVFFRKGFLKYKRKAFLEEKIIDNIGNSYFLVKLFKSKKSEDFDYVIMKSKLFGKRETIESYPIVNIYKINGLEDIANIETKFNDFKMIDMAYVKPSN